MIIQEKEIQILVDMGLTSVQAKTYLTLIKLGNATVKTISKASNIVSQDTYRIMPKLQKLGLAEKIVSKPIRYRATPIKKSLVILLHNKKNKYDELEKETSWLINNLHRNTAQTNLQEENIEFKINSEMKLTHAIHEELTQKAQTSVDIATPLKAVKTLVFYNLESYKKAMKKGVKIRMLAQKDESEPQPRMPPALVDSPFELKCLSNGFQLGMHIFDRKEMTLCISDKGGITSLRSTNPAFVTLSSNYFNEIWNKNTAKTITK